MEIYSQYVSTVYEFWTAILCLYFLSHLWNNILFFTNGVYLQLAGQHNANFLVIVHNVLYFTNDRVDKGIMSGKKTFSSISTSLACLN